MIIDSIKHFVEGVEANFFMPGHKGSLCDFDITELDQTDDLYRPQSFLAQAQAKTASIFGAARSFYLVNGSTVGILAAITACCKSGDKLAINQCCHRSVINAAKLAGVNAVFIKEPKIKKFNIPGSIEPQMIVDMLSLHPDIVGLVVTSPTYYGVCSDIKSIADIMHERGKFLFVDSAHGAHVMLDPRLPLTPIECGADACVMSAHKTLKALTQSSVLHINHNSLMQSDRIFEQIKILQTSSPSFLLLTYLEQALNNSLNTGTKVLDQIKAWQEKESDGAYSVLTEQDAFDKDIMRIVINFSDCGIIARDAARILFHKYKIAVEMYDEHNIVCIATFWNKASELSCLFGALKSEWANEN